MTLNIAQWRERLADRFSGIETIDDSVFRFTRDIDDRPFAVYYVDVSDHLPASREELASYQDRVIGKRYFDGSKSLQWSNYLLFVTSATNTAPSEEASLRRFIEQDRSYARKFVVTEDELEAVVEPLTVVPSDSRADIDILSVWTDQLQNAGLATAVLSEESLPRRMALIEESSVPAKTKRKPATKSPIGATLPQLRSITLSRYRDFPRQRAFDLGTVNLIVGANGTGKTSFLEAIELLYCGRTKRNPQADEHYEIAATFVDGTSEKASNSRSKQAFRDRNLAWYGRSEVRTSNLYLSFAQFNFLETDAAVSLLDSASNFEEDLSKLLVGPQTSKAWREIERMSEQVAGKLRELQPVKNQIQNEIFALDTRLKPPKGVTHASDAIFTRLEEMVRRLGWSLPDASKNTASAYLIEPFAELESLIQQATSVERVASPTSLAGLQTFCDEADRICTDAEATLLRLEQMKKDEHGLAATTKRLQRSAQVIVEAERIATAALPSRLEDLQHQRNVIAKIGNVLAATDEDLLARLKMVPPTTTISAYRTSMAEAVVTAEHARSVAEGEYRQFTELRSRSANLAQQLRDLAIRLLEDSASPDRCPLCDTQFEDGQLNLHIHRDVDPPIEARAQLLLSQLHASEERLRNATVADNAAAAAMEYSRHTGIAEASSVPTIIESIEAARQSLDSARHRAAGIEREIRKLEAQGLSADRVTGILSELRGAGYSLAEWSQDLIAGLKVEIDQDLAESLDTLNKHRSAIEQLQRATASTLQVTSADIPPMRIASSQLREQQTLVARLLDRFRELLAPFPWSRDKPLAELRLAVESIRAVAVELQVAVNHEHQAKILFDESGKRKSELMKQLDDWNKRITRFDNANKALNTLITRHSLSSAMSTALQRNRATIESIFRSIHAPAEFSGLGKTFLTLIRKRGSVEAKLSQISTGQRAALALSIFLAQNAQLKFAPPILLIDDPIAHIDDLNSLSFLDFLRDLAVTGNRQIVFSTANAKLATLFERKFDFLGPDGFRRYDLER